MNKLTCMQAYALAWVVCSQVSSCLFNAVTVFNLCNVLVTGAEEFIALSRLWINKCAMLLSVLEFALPMDH